MDAFSVSIANALNEPRMKIGRMNLIAGTYAFFQFAMPMIGWVCVHTIVEKFTSFEKFIPWIALALLGYIGGTMLVEGIRKKQADTHETGSVLGFGTLLVQGVATSIDAAAVGLSMALDAASWGDIAPVALSVFVFTALSVVAGMLSGSFVGRKLGFSARIVGGLVLIGLGIHILL